MPIHPAIPISIPNSAKFSSPSKTFMTVRCACNSHPMMTYTYAMESLPFASLKLVTITNNRPILTTRCNSAISISQKLTSYLTILTARVPFPSMTVSVPLKSYTTGMMLKSFT